MGSKERCRKMKDGGEYRQYTGRTRANSRELRRTPANVQPTPANVRRSSAECWCLRTDGEFAPSSREFARVRPSSRQTTVRRVYCPNISEILLIPTSGNFTKVVEISTIGRS